MVDLNQIVQARPPSEPYRVVKGDVLELTMPDVMRAMMPEGAEVLDWRTGRLQTHLCRVSQEGTIPLLAVGEVPVAGKMLSEVEAAVVKAYYPKYVVALPAVVAQVKEYQTQSVSIMGAVKEPGQYALRSDELSLAALLMKAGGIDKEGAAVIRIRRPGATGEAADRVVLPIKGLKTPFADVPLKAGDVVEVEEYVPRELLVMGLVNKPGVYPYPPQTTYNLMQALAFGGGVDTHADPQYAKIYRQTEDGKVVAVAFKLDTAAFTEASNILIKPGDVVAVEHTAATRTRQFFTDLLRFGFGLSAGYDLNP
jgi:protein involved in polysaccharide export with SLBB domain